MKCNEFEILIDEYIDGAISSAPKKEFELHMQECESCRKEYTETVKLLETVSTLPKEAMPMHDLWANIESRISTGNGGKKKIFDLKKANREDYSEYTENYKKNSYLKYGAIALIAAMVLIALLPSLFLNRNTPLLDKVMTPYWKVNRLSGITIAAANIIGDTDSLKVGDWLETKDSSRALLNVPGLGTVTIEPNSKLRITKSETDEHRIDLVYGTINANIDAKPRTFYVDSKSATAIDLGCAYTYTVSPNGDGILYVKQGMVSLQSNGRESLVPEGKFCLAKAGIGPGTPFRENTSAALKDALMKYDFEKGGDKEVEAIIKNSKKSDMVTLINLLPRVDASNKTKLYNHITQYTPAPRDIPRDSVPNFDAKDLNEWIQKFQKEWKEEMQQNMKELQENLKNMSKELRENLSKLPKDEYDNGQFNEELQQQIQENIEKHMDKLENLNKMIVIPNDLIEKSVQESLEKANEELEKNGDRIDREMEKLQDRMERLNERMQDRMEEQKERQEELKDRQKERDEELKEREDERKEELKERDKDHRDELKERENEYKEKYKDYWKNYKYNFNFDNLESLKVEPPDVEAPDVEAPDVEAPDVETPEVESFDVETNEATEPSKKNEPENNHDK